MSAGLLLFQSETIQVNSRVTGQRFEVRNQDFGSKILPPELVREILTKNAQKPIVVLVIQSCKLVSLPKELSQLTFLHELDVSNNELTDLPIELLALSNLVKLNLSSNKFKELPVFIGHLPNLIQLQVLNMPALELRPNLLRNGTEAICAFLRSSFVVIEEKQEELARNVRETLNVAKHADICFVVEGQPIHAHRLVVALRISSPILAAMLASPNKEHEIVGVRKEVFMQLLKYAYGNGLYEADTESDDREFQQLLTTLQVTSFGRNMRLVSGGVCMMPRTNTLLRQDFRCLFHKMAAKRKEEKAEEIEKEKGKGKEKESENEKKAARRETRTERRMREQERQLEREKKRAQEEKEGEWEAEEGAELLNEDLLRRHDWFADLRIRCVDGNTFHCHKFLLCVRSPYFQAKFEGGMADALDKEILVDEFGSEAISQMIRFLYTDEASADSDNAVDLLDLSGHYQLERLRSIAEKFIGENIDHENVLSLLQVADHYQAYHLKVFCSSYVIKHKDSITKTDEWRAWRTQHPELYSHLVRLLDA